MAILLTLIYRFNAIPIKISAVFFAEIDKLILESIWKNKRSRIARTILKKKNKVGTSLAVQWLRLCTSIAGDMG